MKEKIEKAIEKIRPHLKADGGDIELVSVSPDGVVSVRLKGACSTCPMAQMTMQSGVTRLLKQEVPEIKEVRSVD